MNYIFILQDYICISCGLAIAVVDNDMIILIYRYYLNIKCKLYI